VGQNKDLVCYSVVVIQALYLMTQAISIKAQFRPKGKAMGI